MEIVCYNEVTGEVLSIGHAMAGYPYFTASGSELFGEIELRYNPENYKRVDVNSPSLIKKNIDQCTRYR